MEQLYGYDGNGGRILNAGGRAYPIRVMAEHHGKMYRFFLDCDEANSKGETIMMEFSVGYWEKDSKLWDSWAKLGWRKKTDTLLFLQVYVTDSEGRCWGRYNPQVKLSEDGKRQVVDFSYLPEANADGYKMLIDETMRRFREAV